MMDWGRIFEIAIGAAPAVLLLLLAAWLVWFVRRVYLGIARLFRREETSEAPRQAVRRPAGRIEPVFEQPSSAAEPDPADLMAVVQSLTQRVEALEQHLVAAAEPRGAGKAALRLVSNDEMEPA